MRPGVFEFRSNESDNQPTAPLHTLLGNWQRICRTAEAQQAARIRSVERVFKRGLTVTELSGGPAAFDSGLSPWSQALLLATLRWPAEDAERTRALHGWLRVASPEELSPFWDLLVSGLLADAGGPGWIEPAADVLAGVAAAWRRSAGGLSLMEWWEQTFSPQHRQQYGVFHTPRDLAEIAWSQIPWETWHAADAGPILDPAAGTQIFACAALRHIARRPHSDGRLAVHRSDIPGADRAGLDLMRSFLQRLVTIEISPIAWILGFLEVARTLQECGDRWEQPPKLRFWLDDALQPVSGSENEKQTQDFRRQDYRWVVGNPPYSSRVEDQNPWMLSLLKGQIEGPGGNISYYDVQGEPLGERKSWLHDLYVCFFRKAQWWTHHSEESGIAFVTNRGFIDNVTFRGMRESLGESFPQIDLHELNSASSEATTEMPSPLQSGGWFGIRTSTCLAILQRRKGQGDSRCQVHWRGAIAADSRPVETPAEESPRASVQPTSPEYEWHPNAYASRHEFDFGWCLTTLFHNSGSPIVTARDALVIALSPKELIERIQELAEERVSDEELRGRYFSRARSRRYVAGDTRGWKLKEAREVLRRRIDGGWDISGAIFPVHYRAFDLRYIAWLDELIDWPRHQVMATLECGAGWALVARRQSPLDRAANYVTATRNLVVDGVLRSDNRGNETVFPLTWIDSQGVPASNLNRRFKSAWRKLMEPTVTDRLPSGTKGEAAWDELLLGYLFAWLNSTEYQERFRHQLVRRYPKVPLVNQPPWVQEMSVAGLQLLRLHAMMATESVEGPESKEPKQGFLRYEDVANVSLARGFPRFDGKQIILGDNLPRFNASAEVWELRVGAHQVALKWIRDRRKDVGAETLQQYNVLLTRLQAAVEQRQRIDQWVANAGGIGALYQNVVPPVAAR